MNHQVVSGFQIFPTKPIQWPVLLIFPPSFPKISELIDPPAYSRKDLIPRIGPSFPMKILESQMSQIPIGWLIKAFL